jgi:hypothetical protein
LKPKTSDNFGRRPATQVKVKSKDGEAKLLAIFRLKRIMDNSLRLISAFLDAFYSFWFLLVLGASFDIGTFGHWSFGLSP